MDDDRWWQRLGEHARCPRCAYSMFALTKPQCPECGLMLELQSFTRPRYAGWVNRINLACMLGPVPASLLLALLMRLQLTGIDLVCMVLFGLIWFSTPILGLVTLPWTKDYCDASAFNIRPRTAMLFFQVIAAPPLLILLAN